MINARTFLGHPTNFQNICWVYPPLIKDIIDNDKYSIYAHFLTLSQEEIYDSLNESPIEEVPQFTVSLELDANGVPKLPKPKLIEHVPTPLEYLLANSYKDKSFLNILQNAFQFFIHTKVTPLWDLKAIYLGDEKTFAKAQYQSAQEMPILTEDNFHEFQNCVRRVIGNKPLQKMDQNEDPRIMRMKAKARFRDQVKANDKNGISLETMLAAICCSNLNITPLNIGEISYGAARMLLEMTQNKEKYSLDVESLLAGADPHKVKPKHWISNLND